MWWSRNNVKFSIHEVASNLCSENCMLHPCHFTAELKIYRLSSVISISEWSNLIWTIQDTLQHLSQSLNAWETSNQIISSSLIRTSRSVPLLSILKKSIANVKLLTAEVGSPRTVPAGLSCSQQTQAAPSIPLPSLFARLFFDSLQQVEKIKLQVI